MIELKEKKFYNMKYDKVFKSVVEEVPEVLNRILSDISDE